MSEISFYLSNIREKHTRKVYNVIDLLSEVGGIYAIAYAFIGFIGRWVNIQLYMSTMIEELQFIKLNKKQ